MSNSTAPASLSSTAVVFPQQFWLNDAFLRVAKSFNSGKLPHALMIVAPNGSGKNLFADRLAKSLLCSNNNLTRQDKKEEKQLLGSACGGCKSCYLLDAGSHPDLSSIDCLNDNKGKQKKSIGIDQIRQLTCKLLETSQLGGWRIVIVRAVEKLTRGAFNAILKTLEEPGSQTLIVMLANSLETVPATIRSRCQVLSLKLTQEQLLPWLMQAADREQSIALDALEACHFAPFAALEYLQQGQNKTNQALKQALDQVLSNQTTVSEFLSQYSEMQLSLWEQIAGYFRQVLFLRLALKNSADSATDSEAEKTAAIYAKIPQTLPAELYSQLLEYHRAQLAGSNLHPNLQLEAILLQWFEIGGKIVHYSNKHN